MAARAAMLAAKRANENSLAKDGPVGKKRRKLKRRESYVDFLESHNPKALEHVLHEIDKPEKKKTVKYNAQTFIEDVTLINSKMHKKLVTIFVRLRDSQLFKNSITLAIFVAGILVGLQTYESMKNNVFIEVLDLLILFMFVLEIVVKIIAEGKYPWKYFYSSWNVFDFCIVLASFMPFKGNDAVAVFRLLRLLRVFKLVKALPKLRILVMGLIKSFASIAYISLLMFLAFFLFAVVAVTIFGANDPVHLGTLHIAFLTLFRAATLEDWTDIMYTSMYGCKYYGYDIDDAVCQNSNGSYLSGAIFWILFTILATFMILNLFIGVITTSMNEAKEELLAEAKEAEKTVDDLEDQHLNEQQSYTQARLMQIEEIIHTMAEEFQELATKQKERVSNEVIFLSNRIRAT
jgi:voltage-gated sodium channel